ncbi:hypothetical protein Scep_017112 [Stephania cephalantha]|uniref:Uncharacterized protein n=1 Tax=Stephania cephalantha TaxID=152367 RepID=A0AAP0NUR1_9MAGN
MVLEDTSFCIYMHFEDNFNDLIFRKSINTPIIYGVSVIFLIAFYLSSRIRSDGDGLE